MTQRNKALCGASIFDRTICHVHDTMHTFTCCLPEGHEGAHEASDGDCRTSWTDEHTWYEDNNV